MQRGIVIPPALSAAEGSERSDEGSLRPSHAASPRWRASPESDRDERFLRVPTLSGRGIFPTIPCGEASSFLQAKRSPESDRDEALLRVPSPIGTSELSPSRLPAVAGPTLDRNQLPCRSYLPHPNSSQRFRFAPLAASDE